MANTTNPTILLVQTQAENAGAQEIARILGQSWSARGFDVHYSFFFRRTDSFDDIPNVHFAFPRRPTSPWEVVKMASSLFRHVRSLKPDAVLTFQHYGNILGAPVVRAAGARRIFANLNSPWDQLPFWVLAIEWLLAASGIYSKVIANSASTEAAFSRMPRPFMRSMIRIDHGFEPKISNKSKLEARAILQLPRNAVLLGCVGRLHAQKNHSAAIALLPRNPCWHLAIAGQGECLAELQSLSHQQGCQERVHFVGELPSNMMGEFLRALDVFVFPSRTETFGLAAVEAAQSGALVVCHDLDVMREVLQVNGKSCARFVDVNDSTAFEASIRETLQASIENACLLAAASGLRDKYSLASMVDGYTRTLEESGINIL